jgi:predicted MPP superfamily phosphohydrolase
VAGLISLKRFLLGLLLAGGGLVGFAYWTAISDPIVRHARIELLPASGSEKQIRILLISDIHVAGPDMPPARLQHVVSLANRLKPDAVLIAGDFISEKRFATTHYRFSEVVAPLKDLRSQLGTFAVLGNHDHWADAAAARAALRDAGAILLDNAAARAGPLVIGGLDDAFTGHADLDATFAAMNALGGTPILLSHSPDPFPRVPPNVKLMLAGHTHCGQIRLPLLGAISYMSEFGDRYACGVVVERGKTLVVGAGLGTSILPLRLGAVPDMWLITLTRPSH